MEEKTMAASADGGGANPPAFDMVVVGAGISGLISIHRARQRGWSVCCFEAGSGVGGTWYWNRYPGCRVDIESFEYSYSFSEDLQQEWTWSERYAPQPELERYLNHVADRFGLREHIRFDTRIAAAHWNAQTQRWTVRSDGGHTVSARLLVMATGTYSDPYRPHIEGIEQFRGLQLQSSRWPREPVEFRGKRVGIIGTGATGVQLTPILAQQADRLTVFQRTASYTVPLQNHAADPEWSRERKKTYAELREAQRVSSAGFTTVHSKPVPPPVRSALEVSEAERRRVYEERWSSGGLSFYHAFTDLLTSEPANRTLEAFFREKIRSRVKDPEVARKLTPVHNPALTKRLAGDTRYCETFDRDNVELVDLRAEPIRRFTATGLVVGDREVPLDIIIFATGFDLATGAMGKIDIRGRDGRVLKDEWKDGIRTYLGMMSHGYPNLFWLFGPGSPFYNPVLLAQYQVEQIERFVDALPRGQGCVEATAAAQAEWSQLTQDIGAMTLFTKGQNYYMGDNIPGKPREVTLFLGGFPMYCEHCEAAATSRKGFEPVGAPA
jgi:cation diffusion facilitator CzcD-associated flavoprotein CzcO